MKSEFKFLFALFATVTLLFISVATPGLGEEETEEEEEGCNVSGHVYVADSGKPMREAAVIIHRIGGLNQEGNYITVTNGEGYYEFAGIPAGEYYLVVAYGSDFEWGWSDMVCMGTYAYHAWVDVNIAGIHNTNFEVGDGESIKVDAPIEPTQFYRGHSNSFGPPPII